MEIAGRKIGIDQPPYIIAEMSGNHNQSLDRALELVRAASQSGAHALKLQTYTADTMTIDSSLSDFVIQDKESLWAGRKLYELYQEAHTPWGWHKPIFDECRKLGMTCFSSPFDETAADFLDEELQAPAFKIASFENTHLPLIYHVAKKAKPVIVSLGMASLSEIEDIIDTMKAAGNDQLILLKCTSAYPAQPKDANILTIPHLREKFGVEVGLSDHTMGTTVPIAATALGATLVEKHFTLNRADGGVDSAFSLEPEELKALVNETNTAWESLGKVNIQSTASESKSKQFRRSIYVVEDIEPGEPFTSKNTRIIRPGFGLPPKAYSKVLESCASKKLERGHALSEEDLKA